MSKDEKEITSYFDDKQYIENDITPTSVEIKDENDISLEIDGYYEIKTDNKFLFFNNTEDGFNTETWDESNEVILTGFKKKKLPNLYLLLNNSENGYTADTIDKYYESNKEEYNVTKDIINNAFALKINNDGSIGYRYLVSACNEQKYDIIEEKSLPNIIKRCEWNNVKIVIEKITDNNTNENNKMIIKIYVDDKLKFISKELPLLNLRSLNELEHRQEGVAYNISLGGGTMGLCDSIWLNYYKPFKYILPLEKYFSGTFNGDIQSFKISYNN